MASDEILCDRLLGGDLEALDALYTRYERHLFGFILAQIGDRPEAEDVLHDAFLAVLQARRTGGCAPTCFRAWIYQVARNLCLKRARSQKRAARAIDAAAQVAPAPPEGAEGALVARQSGEALRRAVARLPRPLAEIFQLRAGGLSYEELAEVLEIPIGTVKSRMHELVSRLRAEVKP